MKQIIEDTIGVFLKDNFFRIVKVSESEAIYSNSKCILLFNKEYCDIYLYLSNPSNQAENYHIGVIIKSIYNESIKMFGDINICDQRIKYQLINYNHLLSKKLNNIISGNFTWIETYKKFEEKQKQLLNAVQNLPKESPIYQKYLIDDMSWKDDILSIM